MKKKIYTLYHPGQSLKDKEYTFSDGKNTGFYLRLLLCLFILLPLTAVHGQNISVTPTNTFCEGDGKAIYNVSLAKVGSTYDFILYKAPDTTTPYRLVSMVEATTTAFLYTEDNLPQGSYTLQAVQNFEGDHINLPLRTFTVGNSFVAINPSHISIETTPVCGGQGMVTVNLYAFSGARPARYELRDLNNQVLISFQESNVLGPVDAGTYRLAVEDVCGNITVKDVIVTVNLGTVQSTLVATTAINVSTYLSSCNTLDFKQPVQAVNGAYYIAACQYPVEVTIKVTKTGTNEIVYQNTGIVNNLAEANAGIPVHLENFNLGDKWTYSVSTKDACGIIYNAADVAWVYTPNFGLVAYTGDCGARYFSLSSVSYFAQNTPTTVTFTQYPAGFKPWEYNASFSNGEYSHTYNTLPPELASGGSGILYFGSASNTMPDGTYQVTLSNACGASVTRNITLSTIIQSASLYNDPDCGEEGWSNIGAYINTGTVDISGTVITSAPQAFIDTYGPLPFNASAYLVTVSGKKQFRMRVPDGSYNLQITNSCGQQITRTISTIALKLTYNNATYKRYCGGYFMIPSITTNWTGVTAPYASYYLQKWYPNAGVSGAWGHPSTGVTSDVLTSSSMQQVVLPYTQYYYTGDFRVIATPSLRAWSTVSTCFNRYFELERFTIPVGSSILLNDYYTIGCNNGAFNLLVDASGIGTLSYEIIRKDGQAFVVNNGTNPVFSGLSPGEYTLRITDSECGDALVANVKLLTDKLPAIKAQELCEGQSGRLYVNGASYLTVQWYKNGVNTGVTGHSFSFNPYNSQTHQGMYEARLSYPSNPNWCSDGNTTLYFDLKPSIMNNVSAGSGKSVTISRSEFADGLVNLFDYLEGSYDTHGEWTEITQSGYLLGNMWYISYVPGGTYQFKYRVEGTCSSSDETLVTIKLIGFNYWHGTIDTDWGKNGNWTGNYVPSSGENIEFATSINNGPLGSGNNTGAAQNDLYLDQNRIIRDLINDSNKDLVITTGNQLTINGEVKDNNTSAGTIVVKAATDEASGTLLFADPSKNSQVNATVEFYNKAYECATCGFYRKQWQYFGIPVQSSVFPYQNPQVETVNQWIEPYNGDKWRSAPYASDTKLKAFYGYEMTNSSNTEPTHIYSFPGILNVGSANVAVTKSPNVNYAGMNLIGNSFAAAIPITSAAISLGNVELESNTVYLFNMGTRDQWRKLNGGTTAGIAAGQYQSVPFNLAGQAGIPDRILSMHTFMLDVKTPGDISLEYGELVKNELNQSTTLPWKSAELRSSTKTELPHIVMDVIAEGSADRVWLFEQADATTGFDNGWDGYKIKEGDLIQAYVAGSDQSDYQIATVGEIPGTIIGVKGESQGSYSVNLSVSPDIELRKLYLEDLLTGRTYPVVNNAEYAISGSNASAANRFKITDSATALIGDITGSSLLNIYVSDNVIVVDNQSQEECAASVYDLSGRLVAGKQVPSGAVVGFTEISQYRAGVYIVKVVGKTGSIHKTDRVLLK